MTTDRKAEVRQIVEEGFREPMTAISEELSDERLAHLKDMLQSQRWQTGDDDIDAEIISMITELQTLRSAEPVAWVDPRTIADLQQRGRWTTAILTTQQGENATMPIFVAPSQSLRSGNGGEVRADKDSLRILRQFADQYRSGAAGAEMDCDAAMALALSIDDALSALDIKP